MIFYLLSLYVSFVDALLFVGKYNGTKKRISSATISYGVVNKNELSGTAYQLPNDIKQLPHLILRPSSELSNDFMSAISIKNIQVYLKILSLQIPYIFVLKSYTEGNFC